MPSRRGLLAMALTVAVLGSSAVALAATGFIDVPTSSPFRSDIQWLADTGVTRGCNPPANNEFCPKATVTREQMAAFLHRFGTIEVEHTVSIDQVGFFPFGVDTNGYIDYDYQAVGPFGRLTGSQGLAASLPVPDGATITGFEFVTCANGSSDQTAQLVRRPDPGFDGYGETLATVTTSGEDCAVHLSTTSISNPVVDLDNYSYAVLVYRSGGGSGFVRRVKVTYTEPLVH